MVTAWSPRRIARARAAGGPLLRLLAFGVLLFGVALAHGASAETAGDHVVTSAVSVTGTPDAASRAVAQRAETPGADAPSPGVPNPGVPNPDVPSPGAHGADGAQAPDTGTGPAASLGAADDRHGAPSPAHPGDQCASGQPTQGSASAPPCLAPSVGRPDAPGQRPRGRGPGGAEGAVTSSADLKSSVVQQV
ncbi:hypothetical protein GCM10018785_58330 [Streptomyces longispororuber]|uniref:Uncharacterized protein n=1 Tax=Streptomyces longispororuber TaxID=68230 RepID=A0A919DVJ3_9ACTN|nr:hypothetical protein [Streptomyces longispororuber]GHE82660.1 hypothetical protein GCM10018785_58330 [Streptomyces longispororuber]